MKIGITDDAIRDEQHYFKLKSCGFDYCDFNMANTNSLPYELDDQAFEEYLINQRRLAEKAGITITETEGAYKASTTEMDWKLYRAERYPVPDAPAATPPEAS